MGTIVDFPAKDDAWKNKKGVQLWTQVYFMPWKVYAEILLRLVCFNHIYMHSERSLGKTILLQIIFEKWVLLFPKEISSPPFINVIVDTDFSVPF